MVVGRATRERVRMEPTSEVRYFHSRKGDVRAERALQISSFARFNTYAKIIQIRCTRDFASCHGPGYRTKKDIKIIFESSVIPNRLELIQAKNKGLSLSAGNIDYTTLNAMKAMKMLEELEERFPVNR